MNSISLDLPSDADQDRLSVRSIHKASPGEDVGAPIDELAAEIESLTQTWGLVVVDDITRTVLLSGPLEVMGFFYRFQQPNVLCGEGYRRRSIRGFRAKPSELATPNV